MVSPAAQHLPWGRGGAGVAYAVDPVLDGAVWIRRLVEVQGPPRTGSEALAGREIMIKHVSMRVHPLVAPRRPGMRPRMGWQKWVDDPVFLSGMPGQPQAAKTRA